MISPNSKIVFIKPRNSSFVLGDEKILKKYFQVSPFLINKSKNKYNYFYNLFLLTWFLIQNTKKSEALFIWFADYEAALMVFFGKLFRKKTIIFAGGQEAICYKELGKGVYLKKIRSLCVKFAIRNATLVLPNHKSLIYHQNSFYTPENPHIDGISHYVPNHKSKLEVISNGIDTKRIKFDSSVQKQSNLIFTVGNVQKFSDFYNKGFDLFIEVARKNPDLEFVIINIKGKFLEWVEKNYQISKIQNLRVFKSFCSDDILTEHFNKAKVYVQVSITEGMPVSLSEAMLCECIPVGSNVNGIPDAIGENGIIIYKRSVDELESAIRKALTMNTGKMARQYTIENYSIEVREKKLLDILINSNN